MTLVVQWLRLHALNAEALVRSLVEEDATCLVVWPIKILH